MLEEMASFTSEIVLYIPLLDEGTDVLRPTKGIIVEPGVVRVIATKDYDPDIEQWEFPPGTTVRCASEVRGGREVLVARHRVV